MNEKGFHSFMKSETGKFHPLFSSVKNFWRKAFFSPVRPKKGEVKHVSSIALTGHVLRRLDLSNMIHHRPLVRGDDSVLISSELSGEKWLLSFTFGPV